MGGAQSSAPAGKRGKFGKAQRASTSADLLRALGGNIDEPKEVEEEEEQPEEDLFKPSVSPPKAVLCMDLSTIVELTMRCESLPQSKPTFLVVYSKWAKDTDWVEIGMTEVNSNGTFDPQFKKGVQLEFRAEMTREVRFELFHRRAEHLQDELEEHQFMGCVEATLAEIFICRAQPMTTRGWFSKGLENPLKFADKNLAASGTLCVYAEELVRSKQLISWEMEVSGITSRDRWKNFGRGSPDAYCVVQRARYHVIPEAEEPEVVLQPVYRTEVCRRSKTAQFERLSLPANCVCHMDEKQEFVVEVFDWFRVSEAEYIGEASLAYEHIFKHFKDTKPLVLQLVAKEAKTKKGLLSRLRGMSKSRSGSSSPASRSPSGSRTNTHSPGNTHSPSGSKLESRGRSSRSPMGSKEEPRGRSSRSPIGSKDEPRGRPSRSPNGSKEEPRGRPSRSPVGSKEAPRRSSDGSRGGSMSPSKEPSRSRGGSRSPFRSRSLIGSKDVPGASPGVRSPNPTKELTVPDGKPGGVVKSLIVPGSNTLAIPGMSGPRSSKLSDGSRRSDRSGRSGGSRRSGASPALSGAEGSERRKPTNSSANHSLAPSQAESMGRDSAGKESSHKSSNANSGRASSKNSKAAKKDKKVGLLTIVNVGSQRRFTFLDYVRSGLQIRLALAIDFTRSNAKREPACHGAGVMVGSSPYATAIRAVGKVISTYDVDDKILAYGFGAKIPPSHTVCSDCFALSGDYFEPELDGIDEVVKNYKRALQIVQMHGPTKLSPVVKLVSSLAEQFQTPNEITQQPMVYYLLVVITDGQVRDELATIDAIVESSKVPMSTVFIGMGPDEDHSYLKDLSQEVTRIRKIKSPLEKGPVTEERHVCQYVPYQMYEDCPEELAGAALADIPREVVGYYQGVKIDPPRMELFEDKFGVPHEKWLPTEVADMSKGGKTKSRQTSRSPFATKDTFGGKKGTKATTKSSYGGESISSDGTMAKFLSGLAGADNKVQVVKKEKRKQPTLLSSLKDQLLASGVALGYNKHTVLRAIQEGLPAASLEVLVDNVMYSGHGRAPPYRAAARQSLIDDGAAQQLPGQVEEQRRPSRPELSRADSGSSQHWAKRGKLLRKSNSRGDDWESPTQSRAGSRSHLLRKSNSRGESHPFTEEPDDADRDSAPGSRRGSTSKLSVGSTEETPGAGPSGRPRGNTKDAKAAATVLLSWPLGPDMRPDGEPATPQTPAQEQPIKGILSRKGTKKFTEDDVDSRTGVSRADSHSTLRAGLSRADSMATLKAPISRAESMSTLKAPISRKGTTRFADEEDQELVEEEPEHLSRKATKDSQHSRFGEGALTCSICLDRPVATKLQPCGHLLACESCAPRLGAVCPLCQSAVREIQPWSPNVGGAASSADA